jgi:hypothetical protein
MDEYNRCGSKGYDNADFDSECEDCLSRMKHCPVCDSESACEFFDRCAVCEDEEE